MNKQNSSYANLDPQTFAQLQAMGIAVYQPLAQIELKNCSWIKKLCSILSIDESDCVFGASKIGFDANLNKLHLPATTFLPESVIKKSIWREIRPFVIAD